jgi:hypothetical protein
MPMPRSPTELRQGTVANGATLTPMLTLSGLTR